MLNKQRADAATGALDAAAPALAQIHEQLRDDRLAGLDALESAVGNLWSDYLERFERACDAGMLSRGLQHFDTAARTSEDEYMDLPEYPEDMRQTLLEILHKFNLTVGTYNRVLGYLRPILKTAARTAGRAPRVLDLASGYGGFPLMLAKNAKQRGIALEAAGSDIHPVHVKDGNARAAAEHLPVTFRVLNAFDMDELEEGEYDLLTINQAIHHFTPGQLAKMIAEGIRVASTGFVGFDYQRISGVLLWGMRTQEGPLRQALPQPYRDFFHDAAISARKMYHAAELELIARAAAPEARVRCDTHAMGHNLLQVMRA